MKKEEKNRYVYIYCDPRYSGEYKYKFGKKILKIRFKPFYIGAAHKCNYKRHLSGNGHSKFVFKRIEKIREENLEPIIRIAKKYFSKEKAFRLEEKLIIAVGRQDLKIGPLLNKSDGRGVKNASISHRKKMSEKSKKMWEDPEFKKRMVDKKNIPEFKKKISKVAKMNWEDPEYRKKMIRQASKLLQERNLKNWEDPKYRKKMSKRSRKMWENPEYRKKISEKRKKAQKNLVEYRKENYSQKARKKILEEYNKKKIKKENKVLEKSWKKAADKLIQNYLTPKGSKNGMSKLTEKKVLEIRNLYKTGQYFQRELAEIFNVSVNSIRKIVNRYSWIHI